MPRTSATQTHVERDAQSPPVPETPGVVFVSPAQASARGSLVLHGAFNLLPPQAEELGHPPHGGLVLVIQSGDQHNVITPFSEHVLFPDDEVAAPGGIGGFFHIDVFEQQGGPAPGFYHVLVSIGEHVSAVHDVAVSP